MVRGARPDVPANDGQTALDLVMNGEVETPKLANDLRKMLVS